VVVGHEQAVGRLVARMQSDPACGLQPVGACTESGGRRSKAAGVPVLGAMTEVVRVLAETGADTVAVAAGSGLEPEDLDKLAYSLEGTGIDLLVQPKLTSVFGTRISERPVAGLPMLHVEEPELTGARRLVKGFFDLVLGTVFLVLVSPVLLVAGLAIRATSRGPAFFRQQRVGRQGKVFTCWKLRTMYSDAAERRAALLEANKHGAEGVLFKLDADPRVTPVGRLLRRYSIDELPQLINVVLGQMSLVGPRPPLPDEVARYTDVAQRRLLVKPGMTGLWQVSGRSDLSWDESVALDLRYVEGWSLGMDLLLLLRTVVAVVRPRGAY
jgi:exopolysaccharide biosynthesis polyprenyl glycosylphosphotransferase